MLHDPHSYSRPSEFRPERFLAHEGKHPEQDPRTICFGFGRRSVGFDAYDAECLLFPASVQVSDLFQTSAIDPLLNTIPDGRLTAC